MARDDFEIDPTSAVLRPDWPASPPAFEVEATPDLNLDPMMLLRTGRVRAERWTCALAPRRVERWLASGASRSVLVNLIDAEPAVPIQLYWALSQSEAFAAGLARLSSADVVVVAVPEDLPTAWRIPKTFGPVRATDPSYPAGNRRLVARAVGLNPATTLVLDAVAVTDLVRGSAARPIAVVESDSASYGVASRDEHWPDRAGAAVPDEVVSGPLLRGRPIGDAIGDGDLVAHRRARSPRERSPCIRCGWCLSICPTRCDPVTLMRLGLLREPDPRARRARAAGIDACVDCGLCTAACPANLPLHSYIDLLRLGGDAAAEPAR